VTDIHQLTHDILALIEQQPQRQDGTTSQLADLLPFAQRLGIPATPFLAPAQGQALTPRLELLLKGLPDSPMLDLTSDQAVTVLRALANRLGFYDAADVLRNQQARS
jgi:hypothetical protein